MAKLSVCVYLWASSNPNHPKETGYRLDKHAHSASCCVARKTARDAPCNVAEWADAKCTPAVPEEPTSNCHMIPQGSGRRRLRAGETRANLVRQSFVSYHMASMTLEQIHMRMATTTYDMYSTGSDLSKDWTSRFILSTPHIRTLDCFVSIVPDIPDLTSFQCVF